jgi:hypothetical protein
MYHGYGIKTPWVGGLNTMDRGVDIYVPWVGGSKYHGRGRYTMGRGLDMPSVGGRYTIGRESKYHGWGVDIP